MDDLRVCQPPEFLGGGFTKTKDREWEQRDSKEVKQGLTGRQRPTAAQRGVASSEVLSGN